MKWNKLSARDFLDDEEREIFEGCTGMWDGPTPELFEEVLVSWGKSCQIFIDEWTEFDAGIGFRDTELDTGDVIYWCEIPEFDYED